MSRLALILTHGLASGLFALGLMSEACADKKAPVVSPTHLVPSTVAVSQGRGPIGLPGLLTSTDVTIGDPKVSYVDPEFLPEQRLMVWQDAAGEVWLCGLEAGTGDMIPGNGKGQFAGRAAPLLTKRNPFLGVTYNGPEFGVSQQGIAVFYSESEQLEIARFDLATRRIDIPVRGTTRNTRALISSKDRDDQGSRVMYLRLEGDPADGGLDVINEWFDNSAPDVVHPIPRIKSGTSGPQWIPGQ